MAINAAVHVFRPDLRPPFRGWVHVGLGRRPPGRLTSNVRLASPFFSGLAFPCRVILFAWEVVLHRCTVYPPCGPDGRLASPCVLAEFAAASLPPGGGGSAWHDYHSSSFYITSIMYDPPGPKNIQMLFFAFFCMESHMNLPQI